jgi:hypothetical protein
MDTTAPGAFEPSAPEPRAFPELAGISASPFEVGRPRSRDMSCSVSNFVTQGNRESRSSAGFWPSSGETRTRTGDTTIFRRGNQTLEQPRKPL